MDDLYQPTEEERKRFGRISHGYTKTNSNPNSKTTPTKFPKSTPKVYDIKKFLRDFGTLATEMKSEISRKKFLSLWYECWKFDKYSLAIEHIKDNLDRFTKTEAELIEKRINEIERHANAI
jgi:hypothetical protein